MISSSLQARTARGSICALLSSILTTGMAFGIAALAMRAEAQMCDDAFVRTNSSAYEIDLQTNPVNYDPLVKQAVTRSLYPDFKMLTDLIPVEMTAAELQKLRHETADMRRRSGVDQAVHHWIRNRYRANSQLLPSASALVRPMWTLSVQSPHKATFDYIERTWVKLVRRTPEITNSTLIPLPNPVLIPGARFQEGYYWDSYFAVKALASTGRAKLVRGQIENFLHLIARFGVVPNGGRTYYLTRSQPPLLSRMIRDYLESRGESLTNSDRVWLRDRVLPLLRKDYETFWMNSQTRYDASTGLNHHFDQLNTPRPERHAADKENGLGKTYRDVRAEAESGKDFTDAFEGEATRVAPVLLNSVLHGVERDIAHFARLLGQADVAREYDQRGDHRRVAMQRLMRDPQTGAYYDYHLGRRERVSILTADAYAPIWMGVEAGSPSTLKLLNQRLLRSGGVMGSEVTSGKQWDAPYTWAPHVFIAVDAMNKAGMREAGTALSRNWVEMVDRVHAEKGVILEKYDAQRASSPVETGDKYVTQEGFLWSNGVYITLLRDQLGVIPQRLGQQ